jgi:hypothetical protein
VSVTVPFLYNDFCATFIGWTASLGKKKHI